MSLVAYERMKNLPELIQVQLYHYGYRMREIEHVVNHQPSICNTYKRPYGNPCTIQESKTYLGLMPSYELTLVSDASICNQCGNGEIHIGTSVYEPSLRE